MWLSPSAAFLAAMPGFAATSGYETRPLHHVAGWSSPRFGISSVSFYGAIFRASADHCSWYWSRAFSGLRRLIWAETPLLSRLFTLRATRSLGFVRSLLKTALAHYHRVPPRQSLHLCDNLGGCPLITTRVQYRLAKRWRAKSSRLQPPSLPLREGQKR